MSSELKIYLIFELKTTFINLGRITDHTQLVPLDVLLWEKEVNVFDFKKHRFWLALIEPV